MKIRKATVKDIPSLIKLFRGIVKYHKKIYTKDDKFYNKEIKNVKQIWVKFIKKNVNNKDFLILIVYDGKKPIAYCISLIKKNIPIYKIKKYGYVSDLYVDKKYRGKGIGKKLLKKSKEFFRKNKLKFMSLEINHNNDPSIKFYEKYGFKEYYKSMRIRI